MNKQFKRFRRNKKADSYEKAAESIFLSYFAIVIVGENFSLVSGNQVLQDVISNCKEYSNKNLTMRQLSNPQWITKDGELFYGVWGQILNRFQRMRLNDCYLIMLSWRNSLFKDEDERWMDDKNLLNLQKEGDGKSAALGTVARSKRFFYLTSNIDGDVEKAGFQPHEVFETKGNIINWQCSTPCTKSYWRIEDDFRFEVLENGKAPPIKYVDISSYRKASSAEQAASTKAGISVGDAEEFNFYDPRGRFHHDGVMEEFNDYTTTPRPGYNSNFVPTPRTGRSTAKKSNKFLSLNLQEKRAMYFRYFVSEVADQIKNVEKYYRPGSRQTMNSIHSNNGVLQSLGSIPALYSCRGNVKTATVLRRDLFSKGELNHQELHDLAFHGAIDSRDEGIFEINIVDPLIHHISYYTKGLNEELVILQREKGKYLEKLKGQTQGKEDLFDDVIVPGSDNLFSMSLQISDMNGVPKVKYYFENLKPSIRKKRESTGIYVDTIIINVQEQQSLPSVNNYHEMPFKGFVSLIVEPLRLKGKDLVKEFNIHDDKPWQLYGQYISDSIKGVDMPINNNSSSRNDENSSAKLIDFVMNAKDSLQKLRIRAIHHDYDGRIEIVSIFVYMPITHYAKSEAENNSSLKGNACSFPEKPRLAPSPIKTIATKAREPDQEIKAKDKMPIMNRQFCKHCRGLARPRVKMMDDKTFIPSSNKRFKQWTLEVKKEMAVDPEKKLTIIEFGAEAALRNQSELLLKQTQMYGATLIRINPVVKTNKKGVRNTDSVTPKGLNNEDAFQLIEDDGCVAAIQKIDGYLRLFCERLKFPFDTDVI